MLERMNGAEQAGIYAMGFRFFEAYNMISYLFAVLLLPIFSGMLERKENPNQIVALSAKILFVGTWLFALIGILWNKQVMEFTYGAGQEEAAAAYRWLMVGCVGFSMQYIYGTLLTARGELKFLIRLMIVAVIINLGLNLFLIPLYGAQGAAMANAFTQCGLLIAEAVHCHRKFEFDLKKEYGRAALFSVLTLGVGMLISQQPAINTMSLAYSVPLFAGFVALAALVTGMLDLKRFIQVIKQRS
jgi:O-antigen/teichoic acid export membrane protein